MTNTPGTLAMVDQSLLKLAREAGDMLPVLRKRYAKERGNPGTDAGELARLRTGVAELERTVGMVRFQPHGEKLIDQGAGPIAKSKGDIKAGHKYKERRTRPGGGYVYVYEDEGNSMVHTCERCGGSGDYHAMTMHGHHCLKCKGVGVLPTTEAKERTHAKTHAAKQEREAASRASSEASGARTAALFGQLNNHYADRIARELSHIDPAYHSLHTSQWYKQDLKAQGIDTRASYIGELDQYLDRIGAAAPPPEPDEPDEVTPDMIRAVLAKLVGSQGDTISNAFAEHADRVSLRKKTLRDALSQVPDGARFTIPKNPPGIRGLKGTWELEKISLGSSGILASFRNIDTENCKTSDDLVGYADTMRAQIPALDQALGGKVRETDDPANMGQSMMFSRAPRLALDLLKGARAAGGQFARVGSVAHVSGHQAEWHRKKAAGEVKGSVREWREHASVAWANAKEDDQVQLQQKLAHLQADARSLEDGPEKRKLDRRVARIQARLGST